MGTSVAPDQASEGCIQHPLHQTWEAITIAIPSCLLLLSSNYASLGRPSYIPTEVCTKVTQRHDAVQLNTYPIMPKFREPHVRGARRSGPWDLSSACVGVAWRQVESVELRCRPRSLLDSICGCSSTASTDGSTRYYPSYTRQHE